MKTLTTEEFIKKAKEIHDDKYDYSLVDYKNAKTKIKIICPKHGVFEQQPRAHLNKQGCPKCSLENKTLTTEEFIQKAKEIHGNKYDYSLVEYADSKTKVKIVCSKHGVFEQIPNDHLNGCGCPKCSGKNKTTEEFIQKAKEIHGNKYDYSLVDYKNATSKIKIVCSKHGIFEQTPYNHLSLHGCPYCKSSKGERKIINYLETNGYVLGKDYFREYRFKNCKGKKLSLPFDFYIPSKNLLIEYQGEQHYEITRWGGKQGLEVRKNNDWIKKNYCENNKINLLTISYKDFKIIEKILEENIGTSSLS